MFNYLTVHQPLDKLTGAKANNTFVPLCIFIHMGLVRNLSARAPKTHKQFKATKNGVKL